MLLPTSTTPLSPPRKQQQKAGQTKSVDRQWKFGVVLLSGICSCITQRLLESSTHHVASAGREKYCDMLYLLYL